MISLIQNFNDKTANQLESDKILISLNLNGQTISLYNTSQEFVVTLSYKEKLFKELEGKENVTVEKGNGFLAKIDPNENYIVIRYSQDKKLKDVLNDVEQLYTRAVGK
jgi:maltodextrin utilization protein YvdJ